MPRVLRSLFAPSAPPVTLAVSTQKAGEIQTPEACMQTAHERNMAKLEQVREECQKMGPVQGLFASFDRVALQATIVRKAKIYASNFAIAYASDAVLRAAGMGAGTGSMSMQAGVSGLGMLLATEMQHIADHFERHSLEHVPPELAELNVAVLKRLMARDAAQPSVHTAELRQALGRFDGPHLAPIGHIGARGTLAIEHRQGVMKSIPTDLIEISHQTAGADVTRRQQMDQKIGALIAMYPSSIHADLNTLTARMRANCFVDEPRRAQVYL